MLPYLEERLQKVMDILFVETFFIHIEQKINLKSTKVMTIAI